MTAASPTQLHPPPPPTATTIAVSLHPRSVGTVELSRGPGSAGGGGLGGRLRMLLSTGIRVPQTSPDARRPDASQPEWRNKKEKLVTGGHMTPRVRVMRRHESITPSVAADARECSVYVAVMQIWSSLMSRRWNLFTAVPLLWTASRPATVGRH